ncbi:MAG: hypothetical protein QOG19_3496, partial [Mycobacterium sp.]|nr:hypothetical protein [Mycobacterium sp.]
AVPAVALLIPSLHGTPEAGTLANEASCATEMAVASPMTTPNNVDARGANEFPSIGACCDKILGGCSRINSAFICGAFGEG